LKVNIAEQLACSIVVAAHAPPPNLVGANESRSPLGGERLFQQPARWERLKIYFPMTSGDWKKASIHRLQLLLRWHLPRFAADPRDARARIFQLARHTASSDPAGRPHQEAIRL
ncbi:MAG: hypothetical protein KGL35_05160, partial [Bradyrhizobium sp.]|nr:hypothetical protein [Bradyrhizobium sp.]